MHMKNSYALITGASSGIGLEIAKNLAKRGYNLILTARRTEMLDSLAMEITSENDIHVDIISKDLSKYETPKEIFEFCESKNYQIDLLVNNAGYGIKTSFHETSIEVEEDFIRVLGTSVIMLTKLFIPKMLSNGGGKIMIISSVASFAAPVERGFKVRKDGILEPMFEEKREMHSQDFDTSYHDAGAFFFIKTEQLMKGSDKVINNFLPYILPRYKVVDIDELEDFHTAEILYLGRKAIRE